MDKTDRVTIIIYKSMYDCNENVRFHDIQKYMIVRILIHYKDNNNLRTPLKIAIMNFTHQV